MTAVTAEEPATCPRRFDVTLLMHWPGGIRAGCEFLAPLTPPRHPQVHLFTREPARLSGTGGRVIPPRQFAGSNASLSRRPLQTSASCDPAHDGPTDSVLSASQPWRTMLTLAAPDLRSAGIKGPFHDQANHRLAA